MKVYFLAKFDPFVVLKSSSLASNAMCYKAGNIILDNKSIQIQISTSKFLLQFSTRTLYVT